MSKKIKKWKAAEEAADTAAAAWAKVWAAEPWAKGRAAANTIPPETAAAVQNAMSAEKAVVQAISAFAATLHHL